MGLGELTLGTWLPGMLRAGLQGTGTLLSPLPPPAVTQRTPVTAPTPGGRGGKGSPGSLLLSPPMQNEPLWSREGSSPPAAPTPSPKPSQRSQNSQDSLSNTPISGENPHGDLPPAESRPTPQYPNFRGKTPWGSGKTPAGSRSTT